MRTHSQLCFCGADVQTMEHIILLRGVGSSPHCLRSRVSEWLSAMDLVCYLLSTVDTLIANNCIKTFCFFYVMELKVIGLKLYILTILCFS